MVTNRANSRSPIVLCCAAALAAALSTVHAVAPDPPAPNPADPVDYIAWINGVSGAGAEDNAFDGYQKAAERFTPINGDWGTAEEAPWTENEPVARFISANREAFELYRAAALRENYVRVLRPSTGHDPRVSRMLMLVELENLSPHRNVAKGLIAEGFRAWAGGDQALLIKNAGTVLRAGRHLISGTTFIERIVGTAEAGLAYSAIIKALDLAEDPHALAGQLREDFEKFDHAFPSFDNVILFERVAAWDLCQRVFVPGSQPGRWELHGPIVEFIKEAFGAEISRRDAAVIGRIGFEKTVGEIDESYDAFEQWTHASYQPTNGQEDREKEHVEKFMHIAMQSRNLLVQNLRPSLARAREIDSRLGATRNATHLIVMLLQHQAEHGKFPRKLDELAADDLAALRTDPYSGKDLVYIRKRRGKSFLLYSVGLNAKDDAGRHGKKPGDGDVVFWPVPK